MWGKNPSGISEKLAALTAIRDSLLPISSMQLAAYWQLLHIESVLSWDKPKQFSGDSIA
jgi:hypothetical protein